jgi:hypothetical protein
MTIVPGIIAGYGRVSNVVPPTVTGVSSGGPVVGDLIHVDSIGAGWYTGVPSNVFVRWLIDDAFFAFRGHHVLFQGDAPGGIGAIPMVESDVGAVMSFYLEAYVEVGADTLYYQSPIVSIGTVSARADFHVGWEYYNSRAVAAVTLDELGGRHALASGAYTVTRWLRANRQRYAVGTKRYWEVDIEADGWNYYVGMSAYASQGVDQESISISPGKSGTIYMASVDAAGAAFNGSNTQRFSIGAWAAGDRLGFAAHVYTAGSVRLWVTKNGTLWNNDATANPATSAMGTQTFLVNGSDEWTTFVPFLHWTPLSDTQHGGGRIYADAADFLFTPPSGYGSWSGL